MDDWEYLKEILEHSVRKNGSVPLTTGHLLSIMNMAERKAERDEYMKPTGLGFDEV